jgi:hypothetical protein
MNALIETVEISGQPVAVVARLMNERGIGYSMCNLKAGDKFNIGRGAEIAIGRAKKLAPLTIVQRLIAITGHAAKKQDPDWEKKVKLIQERLEKKISIPV